MAAKRPRRQELPLDIVREILLRLRVKQLRSLMSVCWSWCSLISSPDFQNEHYRLSQQNRLILRTRSAAGKTVFSTFNKEEGTPVNSYFERIETGQNTVIQCLGWVCIESKDRTVIFVCNPTTAELISVPAPPTEGHFSCIGFGYAASSMEFKLVRHSVSFMGRKSCGEVFTLGGCYGWREARTNPPYLAYWSCAPFLNGTLHFLPYSIYDGIYDIQEQEKYIAAFNVESEEYKQIRLPRYSIHSNLTELEGLLCLNIVDNYESGIKGVQLEIWLLKDYDNIQWEKTYCIDFSVSIDLYLGWTRPAASARPLAIMGDGAILMNVFGRNNELCVLYYDPKNKFATYSTRQNCSAISYVESLYVLRCLPRRTYRNISLLTNLNWQGQF